MEINDLLKQLQKISPSPEYSKQSKLLILSSEANSRNRLLSVFFRNLETSLAIVLGGILLIVFLSGFSVLKLLIPFRVANLDLNNIKAEAQEIDMQINLAELNYFLNGVSQAKKSPATKNSPIVISPDLQSQAQNMGLEISNASDSIQMESALQELAQ